MSVENKDGNLDQFKKNLEELVNQEVSNEDAAWVRDELRKDIIAEEKKKPHSGPGKYVEQLDGTLEFVPDQTQTQTETQTETQTQTEMNNT